MHILKPLSIVIAAALLTACGGVPAAPQTSSPPTDDKDIPFEGLAVYAGSLAGGPLPAAEHFDDADALTAWYGESAGWLEYEPGAVAGALAAYDTDWFANHTLLVAVADIGTGSATASAQHVALEAGTLVFTVQFQLPGKGMAGTADMARWVFFAGLDRFYAGLPLRLDVTEI